MSREIIINSTVTETRVAVLENNSVAEIFIERAKNKGIAGNIYKGKVVKVLPGMQSAFIDIGHERAAFLHAGDLYVDDTDNFSLLEDRIVDVEDADLESNHNKIYVPIEDLLQEGQEIMVQVAKEPIGQKGARLTSHITIPGRYLVLMPTYNHVGVSRKIDNEAERDRLKHILSVIKPPNIGLIARTVSENSTEEELRSDLNYLLRTWEKISERSKDSGAPKLLYNELDLIFRAIRDLTNDDVRKIVIDSKADYLRIKSFVKEYLLNDQINIELYENDIPIFDFYNIEIEISKLMERRVWLKSGGYIVIDQAEALTVIDVNTGKFVGKRNFDETILKTNLEAAKEIAWQMRLRNLGGIIIVDFIDMEKEEHKDKVIQTLQQELKKDRAKTSIVNISPLGLLEITRKRVQDSLNKILTEPCPYCEGRGIVRSKITICYDILREIRRVAPFFNGSKVIVEAHRDIAELILNNEQEHLDDIEMMYNITVEIKPNSHYHLEHYEITPLGSLNV
ncbi:MAG: Rne/Rng family ribonuclease [Deferribacterales bacterium]